MIDETLAALADEITRTGPSGQQPGIRLRQGTIVSVQSDGTATITIGGDDTQIAGVKVASHVCPVPSASCWLAVDGRDLFVIGVLPPYGPAFARMRANATQSIANNSFVRLSFATRTAERSQGLTIGNNGFTVVVPGWYYVTANVGFAANATGRRGIQILCGGSTFALGNFVPPASGAQTFVTASGMVEAAVNDLIEAEVLQSSGGSLSTAIGGGISFLSAHWLRPLDA